MLPKPLVVALSLSLSVLPTATATDAPRSDTGDGAAVVYTAPVPGEVVRAFDPPAGPFGPGHRGVDLRARPGDPVVAAAPGRVVFVGPVVDAAWVSLDHADGIRTSYGPLADVAVEPGRWVSPGDLLGRVAPGHGPGATNLHWGARIAADTYLDPMTLVRGRWRATLVGPGEWEAVDAPPDPSYPAWRGHHSWWGGVPGSGDAQAPGWRLPPNPNLVIGVSGFGSATGSEAFDLTLLGYDDDDVLAFSYGGVDATGTPVPYDADDTFEGVHRAGLALRDHLRAVAGAHPGRAVDLVGHSMGGVVAVYYLLVLHDPLDPALPPVAHVATLASPHQGADLASSGLDVLAHPLGRALVTAAAEGVAEARALRDLAVGSPLLADLGRRWEEAWSSPFEGPLASGTRVATMGASRDLIVPEHRSDLPGAPHVVLPGSHVGVPDSQAAQRALRAFLADEPLPGEPGGAGHVLSYPLSWFERAVGRMLFPPMFPWMPL